MATRSFTAGVAPLASRLALVGFTAGLIVGGALGSFLGSLVGALLGGAMSRIERATPLGSFLLASCCIPLTLFASQATAWRLPQPLTPVAVFLMPIGGLLLAITLARHARPGTLVRAAFARSGWSAIAFSAAILAALRPEADGSSWVGAIASVGLFTVLALDGVTLRKIVRGPEKGSFRDYGLGNDSRVAPVQTPDGGPYRALSQPDEFVGSRVLAVRAISLLVAIDVILLALSVVLRFGFVP
jgi:hypothetical protein